MKTTASTQQSIIVIPCIELIRGALDTRIHIEKLCFWFDNNIAHPVNQKTLSVFLLQAQLFGATIFPNDPQKGCFSLDKNIPLHKGEYQVWQIHYEGDLVYCKC